MKITAMILSLALVFMGACQNKSGEKSNPASSSGSASGAGSAGGGADGKGPLSVSQSGSTSYGNPLVDKFIALRTAIETSANSLNREMDRRGKLRLALGGKVTAGCLADIVVSKIEVIVDGHENGELDLRTSVDSKNLPREDPTKAMFTFAFGGATGSTRLSFSNNEIASEIFGNGIHHVFTPTTAGTLKIGQIGKISIKKDSASYRAQGSCSSDKWDISCGPAHIFETQRYGFSKLEVKVNDVLIYSRSGLKFVFSQNAAHGSGESNGLEWYDDQVGFNEANIAAMQRQDCTGI